MSLSYGFICFFIYGIMNGISFSQDNTRYWNIIEHPLAIKRGWRENPPLMDYFLTKASI